MRMPARMPHRYAARSTLHLPIPAHVHTCQVYALGARDAPPSAASYNFGCCLGIPWGALLRGLGSDGPPCNPAQAVLSSPSGPALLVAASSNFQSVAEWVVDRRLARVPLTITCIRSKPDNQMHTLTPTHTHTYTRTWAHGHTRAHTHTHTHTHTRARACTHAHSPPSLHRKRFMVDVGSGDVTLPMRKMGSGALMPPAVAPTSHPAARASAAATADAMPGDGGSRAGAPSKSPAD